MYSRRGESFRLARAVRWSLPAVLFALAPKCLVCVAAYAGIGAMLGFGGREICGASAGTPGSWASSLAWLGIAAGLVTLGFFTGRRRVRSASVGKASPG